MKMTPTIIIPEHIIIALRGDRPNINMVSFDHRVAPVIQQETNATEV